MNHACRRVAPVAAQRKILELRSFGGLHSEKWMKDLLSRFPWVWFSLFRNGTQPALVPTKAGPLIDLDACLILSAWFLSGTNYSPSGGAWTGDSQK